MGQRRKYSMEYEREAVAMLETSGVTEYQQFLAAHQVTCSMSTVGSCADNTAVEGFFRRLKRERVNRRQYRTRAEARADIFDYIERWHNPRQRRRPDQQQQGINSSLHSPWKRGRTHPIRKAP